MMESNADRPEKLRRLEQEAARAQAAAETAVSARPGSGSPEWECSKLQSQIARRAQRAYTDELNRVQ